MLSTEDNELLCRSGRGTLMGDLLRQYWLPALPSRELPEADGEPKKVRLLGEDLVAFRDTQGRVGLVAENCPHRGASLFFGRNEDCGLRCVYHGWKFDVTGRCVDMPNEPAESLFKDKEPRLELLPTDYGACYSARRRWDVDGLFWHRITQFIMPFFSMIAASDPNVVSARAWVPLDDDHNLQIMMRGRLDRAVTDQEREQTRNPFAAWGGYLEPTSDPRTRHYTKANIHNDYLVDRRLAREELMIGIPFLVNLQDRAMTETMGPIYDRTQEHLGTTDGMVIYVRRRLIEAARALREQGMAPANVDDASMCRVRPASVLLPEGDSWISATEKSRQSDAGVPIAWVPFAQ